MNRQQFAEKLEERRRELRMTVSALARRSGLSRATVGRVLSGRGASPSLDTCEAIAQAMGAGMSLTAIPAAKFKDEVVTKKARRAVRLTQGNVALEGQAIDRKAIDLRVYNTKAQLANSRKLW